VKPPLTWLMASGSKGERLPDAVRGAKQYVAEAMPEAAQLGAGKGPLEHFWNLDPRE